MIRDTSLTVTDSRGTGYSVSLLGTTWNTKYSADIKLGTTGQFLFKEI
jgi:hypothetical protein